MKGSLFVVGFALLALTTDVTLAFSLKSIFFGSAYSGNSIDSNNRGNHILSMSSNPEYIEKEYVDDVFGAPVGPLPTVSSKINWGDQTPQNICHDLWVVGSGTLGMLALKEWMSMYPESKVIAETKTESRHAELMRLGVTPRLRSQRTDEDDMTARYLLLCIPPSAADDYKAEIDLATRLWAGPLGQGMILNNFSHIMNTTVVAPTPDLFFVVMRSKGHMAFTSSTAVYGPSNGNTVDELFRLDTRSERSTKMIAAEESILSRGGSVVRLAGLYTADRGPHTFWLKNGTVDSNADGLVNMLHYEDAASAAVAALLRGVASTVYLAADDEVVTREEICAAAVASGHFSGAKMPQFTSTTGPVGKTCESKWTREVLQWTPRTEYRTFANYMRNTLGGDAGKLMKKHPPMSPFFCITLTLLFLHKTRNT